MAFRRALLLALLTALAPACRCERRATPPPPEPPRTKTFTLRDLALATAVDARAAKLALAGGDVEAALGRAGETGAARGLVGAVEVARVELEQAARAVANAADRPLADALAARGAAYARELAAAAGAGAPAAPVLAARAALGEAIGAYRQARGAWRLEAPERAGDERAFTDSRRELEMTEAAFATGRPEKRPDPAVLRANVRAAAGRARTAAERLPPGLRDAALRWAAAQEDVLGAMVALGEAPERGRPAAARAYQAAKAEALLALADYFAALAAR
jgi:hypothetical protein